MCVNVYYFLWRDALLAVLFHPLASYLLIGMQIFMSINKDRLVMMSFNHPSTGKVQSLCILKLGLLIVKATQISHVNLILISLNIFGIHWLGVHVLREGFSFVSVHPVVMKTPQN